MNASNRREVKSRNQKVFHSLAAFLVRRGFTPNQVSVASGVFALVAACGFFAGLPGIALVLIGIQGRLICNLIDGLMAVEGGLKTATGEMFNEIPDRFSDTVIFLSAAYSVAASDIHVLGWAAALSALTTAYIRVLGASMGTPHFFSGPMAKQHRMFVMNAVAIGSAIEIFFGSAGLSIKTGLALITVGSLLTIVVRARKIANALNG